MRRARLSACATGREADHAILIGGLSWAWAEVAKASPRTEQHRWPLTVLRKVLRFTMVVSFVVLVGRWKTEGKKGR
jgi:hypothetical protein